MPNKYGTMKPIAPRGDQEALRKAAIGQSLSNAMINYKGPKVELPADANGVVNKNYKVVGTKSGGRAYLDDTVGRKIALKNASKTKMKREF